MANVDWDSLTEHLKCGTLKEHFRSTFANQKAQEAYVQYCKYFLSEFKKSSTIIPEVSLSVSLLRMFLSAAPSYVLNGIVFELEQMEWLQSILSNDSVKPAVRGSILSIFTLLVRRVPNIINMYREINRSYCCAISDLTLVLSSSDLNSDAYLGVVIILHQLEELLNALGNEKFAVSFDMKDSLVNVAQVLRCVSTLDSEKVSNTSRIQVDTIKLCGMLCEIWVNNYKQHSLTNVGEESVNLLCSIPQSLFTIITTGEVTHDCFHSAYHGAVQVMYILKSLEGADGVAAAARWTDALQQCVQHISTDGDLLDVVGCARLEIVVGFLSCFYDSETLRLVESRCAVDDSQTDSAVISIITLQTRMRSSLQTTEYTQTPRETQKELKSMYSDIRKGSIASAALILDSSPQWVRDNQSAYWDLSLKSLASPVLFTAGHKAMSGDEAFTTRMMIFLQSALQGITRYSVSAADDIILTLQELLDAGGATCVALFSTSDRLPYNIPQSLLDAYALSPKIAASSNQTEAQLNWRVAVVVTLNSLVQQSAKSASKIPLSFLGEVVARLTSEVVSLTQTDSSSSKKSRRGGNAADLRVELLQSLTVTLISIAELLKSFSVEERSGAASVSGGLRHLAAHLMLHIARPIVFEDDRVQVCSEMDLLVRAATLSSPRNDSHLVSVAVIALSNMLLVRNGCDASLVVDLSRVLSAVDAADFSSKDLSESLSEVRDELRCLHASSLSGSDGQTLKLEGDVVYEATREALLSLAHHCCKDGVSAGSEDESRVLQRIYDGLPLEVNQQPALDTSAVTSDVFRLEIKSSFPLDLLCNIEELLETH